MDTYTAVILDSGTDEYKTLIIEAETVRAALQKVYAVMCDNDILCDIRLIDKI